jgi:tetratricopeptide (TPR) repeat protein
MRLNFFLALVIFTMLFGCAATPGQIEEIYQRQTELEAETERLSRAVEALRGDVVTIEEAYSKLKKRLDVLEKKQTHSDSSSIKSPDALYGLAESYYRKEKFEEAVIEFQRFIDTYPQDIRVPDSYLKQGLSLINIGRKQEARFFLETLINKFPESKESKIAREKLRELSS